MLSGENDTDTGVTTGELSRAVGLIRKDIAEIKTAVPSKESVDNLRQRIIDLEGTLTWGLRIAIPSLCVVAWNAANTVGSVVNK